MFQGLFVSTQYSTFNMQNCSLLLKELHMQNTYTQLSALCHSPTPISRLFTSSRLFFHLIFPVSFPQHKQIYVSSILWTKSDAIFFCLLYFELLYWLVDIFLFFSFYSYVFCSVCCSMQPLGHVGSLQYCEVSSSAIVNDSVYVF